MSKNGLWSVLIALSLSLSACATPTTDAPKPTEAPQPTAAPTPAPMTFTDGLKRTVTLKQPAQRIISLAPSNTEILFAVGAGKQLVGRDEPSDYPAEAKSVTSIGSVFQKMNIEAIVALKPDLVLAASIISQEQVKSLEEVGLTVYALGNPADFDSLYVNLLTVGKLTGQNDNAAKLVDSLKTRVKNVTDKTRVVTKKPKVFYEIDGTDPLKPWTSGPGTFMDTLIFLAGGENIGAGLKSAFAQMSSEELLKQNPDMILLGDAKYGTTVEAVTKRSGWNTLTAVKTNKVLAFDDDLASRPGPRLVDGLETLAKILQPELFK